MEYLTIEIQRDSSPISKETWAFMIMRGCLVLNKYVKSERETTRHKFMVSVVYDRVSSKNYRLTYISESEVSIPGDVKAEAIQRVVEIAKALRVVKWGDVK